MARSEIGWTGLMPESSENHLRTASTIRTGSSSICPPVYPVSPVVVALIRLIARTTSMPEVTSPNAAKPSRSALRAAP